MSASRLLDEKTNKETIKAWAIIGAILDRGNDAIIRKKESGFLIIEEKKKTVYKADRKAKRKNSIQSRQKNEKKTKYTKLIEKRKEKSKQNRQKCENRKWRKTNGI